MLTRGYTFNINIQHQTANFYKLIDEIIDFYTTAHILDAIDFFLCHSSQITYRHKTIEQRDTPPCDKQQLEYIYKYENTLLKLQYEIQECVENTVYKFLESYGRGSSKTLNFNGMFLNKFTYILATEIF